MLIIGIDPGPTESAMCVLGDRGPVQWAKESNDWLLKWVALPVFTDTILVVEQIASMGMAVGESVFETAYMSGRIVQAWGGKHARIKRAEVKLHICGSMRAKDANIRQALIDRFGGKERAIGSKKNPGRLYGMSGDCWSALAVALTWQDLHAETGGSNGPENLVRPR